MTVYKKLGIHRKEKEIDIFYDDGTLFIRLKDLSIAEQQIAEIGARGWCFFPVEG